MTVKIVFVAIILALLSATLVTAAPTLSASVRFGVHALSRQQRRGTQAAASARVTRLARLVREQRRAKMRTV